MRISHVQTSHLAAHEAHPLRAKFTRRSALQAVAALPALMQTSAFAQDTSPLKIAQSIALTGPLLTLGQAMNQGAKACFAAINAKAGVNGRLIELTSVDDGYDVKRALANVKGFLRTAATLPCSTVWVHP